MDNDAKSGVQSANIHRVTKYEQDARYDVYRPSESENQKQPVKEHVKENTLVASTCSSMMQGA